MATRGKSLADFAVVRIDVDDLGAVMAWYARHPAPKKLVVGGLRHFLREGPRWAACMDCKEKLVIEEAA